MAKLLRGNGDDGLSKAIGLAMDAVMDLKAVAKLIKSYRGIYLPLKKVVEVYFGIRDDVTKGRDLQVRILMAVPLGSGETRFSAALAKSVRWDV